MIAAIAFGCEARAEKAEPCAATAASALGWAASAEKALEFADSADMAALEMPAAPICWAAEAAPLAAAASAAGWPERAFSEAALAAMALNTPGSACSALLAAASLARLWKAAALAAMLALA